MSNDEIEMRAPDDVETAADEEQVGLVSGLRQSNRRLKYALAGVLAVVVLVGASVGVYYGAFHKDQGLTVSESSDTSFSAEFVHEDTVIGVQVHNTPVGEPNRLDWTFDFDGRKVDYELDMESRVMFLDGHDNVLTVDERKALAALAGDLAAWVTTRHGSEQAALNVGLLERAADYLSQAPNNYAIPARRYNMGRGGVKQPEEGVVEEAGPSPSSKRAGALAWEQDDGVVCLTWGGVHQARFDGADGSNWSWWHATGSATPSCTGRCGVGCNWFDKEAFQDCHDHDLCVTHFGGSSLFDSEDCGDEFGHAADDYIASYGWFC